MKIFNLADHPELTIPSSAQIIHPAQFQRPNGPQPAHPHQGLNGSSSAMAINAVLNNDPLAGMTPKQIFFDCVWLSEERTATKIMLLCIGKFFDDNARSSSMSYAQAARECGLHEVTAKTIAKTARDRWLRIGVGKGFYVPGKGAQNLYHGICPPELVERLREEKRRGHAVPRDAEIEKTVAAATERLKGGVVSDYPEPQSGVVSDYPEADRGSPRFGPGLPQTTRTSLSQNEGGAEADATRPASPHLTERGFVISEDHGLFIAADTVSAWRKRFPHISDLEAAITGLGTTILSKGRMHPGWTCPEGWMVKPLAEMNQEAADKKRITEARIARTSGGTPPRRNRRAEIDEA